MPPILKTSISANADIYDLNGQWLPRGNYYFSITEISNTNVNGTLSDRSFIAEYSFKPDLVIRMMAIAQARLARRANISHENMPSLPSPTESHSYPRNLLPSLVGTNNTTNERRVRSSPRESNPRRAVEVNNERPMCTICLDFVDENAGRTLPCMHRFHEPCISRWLRTRPHCPVCRRRINGRNARARAPNRVHMTNSSQAIIRDARRQVSDYQRRNRRREYNRIYAGSRVGLIG